MSDPPLPDISTVASPPRRSIDHIALDIEDEPIGAGGQAVVYEAFVTDIDGIDRIALKEPNNSHTIKREGSMEAFLNEAERWKTVDRREREKPRWNKYEHIVGIIDTGETLPWIAMEYMDGGSLEDRLHDYPDGLPVDEALWIGECLCRGLEIAHSYGIAHLDLKPANVLFRETADGYWDAPKIADWGLARVLSEQTGTMDGLSVKYSAPEQFESEMFGDPDGLTDIYQVGAIVYALLTGQPPYTGAQTSVMHDIVYGDDPEPPSTVRKELSEPIDVAVQIALEAEKTDRYRSVAKFEQVLRALRTEQPIPHIVSRHIDNDHGSTIEDEQTTSFVDTEQAIREIMSNNPEMSNAEVAQEVGVGVATVRDLCEEFEDEKDAIDDSSKDQVDAVDATGDDDLSQTEQEIVNLLAEKPHLSNSDIAEEVGVGIGLVRDFREGYDEEFTFQTEDINRASESNTKHSGSTPENEQTETKEALVDLIANNEHATNAEIAEEAGVGIALVRDMRDEYEGTDIPPKIDTEKDRKKEVLKAISENPLATNMEIAEAVDLSVPVVRDIRDASENDLSDIQQKVVDILDSDPLATNADIADEIGVRVPIVRDVRDELNIDEKSVQDYSLDDSSEPVGAGPNLVTNSEPSDPRTAIQELLEENPQMTNAEIAEKVDVSIPVVRDIRDDSFVF